MKKTITFGIVFSILALAVFSADLSDYPDIFVSNGNFNAYIVVDNQAPAFHVILQSRLISFFNSYTRKQILGRAKLASEIDTLSQNLIILGNPCKGGLSNLAENYPMYCENLENKAGIFLAEVNGNYNMIVSGTDSDIESYVDELINYQKGNIEGMEHEVREIEEEEQVEAEIEKEISQQEMIDELNKRIANNTANAPEVPAPEEKQETMQLPAVENPKPLETPGFFTRLFNWLKGLFS